MTSDVALIVEDDPSTADAFSKMLAGMGFTTRIALTLEDATSQLKQLSPAVVLLDVGLPDGNGLSLIQQQSKNRVNKPKFVVITGDNSQSVVVECLRAQVDDFLTKPVSLQSLRGCFGKLLVSQAPANDGVHGADKIGDAPTFGYRPVDNVIFTGDSLRARQLRQDVTDCAMGRLNSIVTGGVGTYKQSVAYAIHDQSGRKGRFISFRGVDLSAANTSRENRTETISASAVNALMSCFDAARNGTLYISDLSGVPMYLQHKLIEWCDANPTSQKQNQAPVLLAGLQRKADAEIEAGRLSAELYYRLAQYVIHVPDLKKRQLDIPGMVAAIVNRLNRTNRVHKKLAPTEMDRLQAYEWPGNVRELDNVINQSFASRAPIFTIAHHLIPTVDSVEKVHCAIEPLIGKTFWEIEKTLLFATLKSVNGDKTLAADMLGISLKTLYNRLKAYS